MPKKQSDPNPEDASLTPRRRAILRGIVVEFVRTAEPVGSKHLLDELDLDVSSATIRNDMAELEREGLIQQPHTSAGRVPTDRGFRTFVNSLLEAETLSRDLENVLVRCVKDAAEAEHALHRAQQLARTLSGLAQELAFVAHPRANAAQVAGLSRLLQEPEARDTAWVTELVSLLEDPTALASTIFEADEVARRRSGQLPVRFVIGSENRAHPLSRCTVVLTDARDPRSGEETLLGYIAPTRMPYQQTATLLRRIADLLEQ